MTDQQTESARGIPPEVVTPRHHSRARGLTETTPIPLGATPSGPSIPEGYERERLILGDFQRGLDTKQIADLYEIPEARAYNLLGRAQDLHAEGVI